MATYTVKVEIDEVLDSALKANAEAQGTNAEKLLVEMVNTAVVDGQITQWVRDKLNDMLKKLTPQQAYTRLKSFEV